MSVNPESTTAENTGIELISGEPINDTGHTSKSTRSIRFRGKTQLKSDKLKTEALTLKALGYSEAEAAAKIYHSINEEMRERLINSMLKDSIPLEYITSITLYQVLIRRSFEILDSTADPKVKTECIRCISTINQEIGKLWGDSQGLAANLKNTLVLKSNNKESADAV